MRGADRQDDRVIEAEQFISGHIRADIDVADKADPVAFRDWWSGATPKRIRP